MLFYIFSFYGKFGVIGCMLGFLEFGCVLGFFESLLGFLWHVYVLICD